MPLRHGLCRVPAFASIALRQPPAAALPIPRMSPEKIPPWIFSGLQKRFALLHVAKPPSVALYWWQVRAKNPSVDFLGIAELLRTSACAKPPSVALYWLASTRQKSLRGFFRDCRIATHFCMRKAALRGSLLIGKYERKIHPWIFSGLQKRPPWLFTDGKYERKIRPWIF